MSLDIDLVYMGGSHWQNITHNLWKMADAAGVYGVLWSPKENNVKFARSLIKPLRQAIKVMKADPDKFRAFNAKNGWGTYDDFVPWLQELLEACEERPWARVRVSV